MYKKIVLSLLVSASLCGHINAMDNMEDDDSNIGVMQQIAQQFVINLRSPIKKDDFATMEQDDDSNISILGQMAQSFITGLWPIIDEDDFVCNENDNGNKWQ